MRLTSGAVIILGALGLVACGGDGPDRTPEESFRACAKAVAEEDLEALYDLMQPSEIEKCRESWERGDEEGRKLREHYAERLGKSVAELRDRPFREVYLLVTRKTFDEGREREPEKYGKLMETLPDAEILGVTYNEDRTRAQVRYKAGETEMTATFHLEAGDWWLRFERQ